MLWMGGARTIFEEALFGGRGDNSENVHNS